MKIKLSTILRTVSNETQPKAKPSRQGGSTASEALSVVDKFFDAHTVVSEKAETAAAKLYSEYLAFCESQGKDWVNPTAFAVHVMNVYRGRSVERDEVIRNGKRIEIYKGLALKSKNPPRPSIPMPAPKSVQPDRSEAKEGKPNEPIPIKDLSREELVICIGELEAEMNATPVVIDEYWELTDLRITHGALEAQKAYLDRENRRREQGSEPLLDWHTLPSRQWVKLTPNELEYLSVKPKQPDKSVSNDEHLLTAWRERFSDNTVGRGQIVDLSIELGLFPDARDRNAKLNACESLLRELRKTGVVTFYVGGLYKLNAIPTNGNEHGKPMIETEEL